MAKIAFWEVTGTISVRRVPKLTGPLRAVEEHLFGVFALTLNNTLTVSVILCKELLRGLTVVYGIENGLDVRFLVFRVLPSRMEQVLGFLVNRVVVVEIHHMYTCHDRV